MTSRAASHTIHAGAGCSKSSIDGHRQSKPVIIHFFEGMATLPLFIFGRT